MVSRYGRNIHIFENYLIRRCSFTSTGYGKTIFLVHRCFRIRFRSSTQPGGPQWYRKTVAYYSKGLTKAEKNYSTTELECLAVVSAVKHFAFYLESLPFKIITDHRSLVYLDKMKNSTSRLTRWALTLQPFVYKIVHRAGSNHGNADGLSRMQPYQKRNQLQHLKKKGRMS